MSHPNKDEVIYWLADITQKGGEFAWIRRTKPLLDEVDRTGRTLAQINEHVLSSDRVKVSLYG
jgi:hypothetical protein